MIGYMTNPPTLGSLPPLPPVDLESLIRDIQARIPDQLAEDVALLAKMARAQRDHLAAHRARWRTVKERDVKVVARALANHDKDWVNPHGAHVYLLWGDSAERPLYVGQSQNILARLGQHLGSLAKARYIKRVQIVPCQNRVRMNNLERQLIRHYQPPWNQMHKGRADGMDRATTEPVGGVLPRRGRQEAPGRVVAVEARGQAVGARRGGEAAGRDLARP